MKKRVSRRRVLYLAAGVVFFACLMGLAAIAVLTLAAGAEGHGTMMGIAALCAIGTAAGGFLCELLEGAA